MSHQIDSLAYANRLRWLPASHKLSFAIALLLLSLLSHPIVQLLIGLWLAVWIILYAGIPGKIYLQLLLLPLGFWLTSVPPLIISGIGLEQIQTIQWDVWHHWGISVNHFYLYVSQTGLHQVSLLFMRVVASTNCLYFILLTTPFTEILKVLRRSRCPMLLIELLLLMYRFIFSLLTIADELWIAQNARSGYRTWRRGMQSLGILIGQLLQRTLDDYRQVSLSLAARGFNGELRVWHACTYKPSRRYMLEATIGYMGLILLSIAFHFISFH